MVCLDTDIIIQFLRNEINSVNLINSLKSKGQNFTTTAINLFELWKGAIRSKKENSFSSIEKFLEEIEILPLDDNSSKKSAEIFEELRIKGEMVDELDVFIGSIAIINKELILTYNKKHFIQIPGIRIFDLSNFVQK